LVEQSTRYAATRRVTVIGAVLNVILSVAKILVGWIGHSQALIADGLHSLSDLLSDGLVLVAAKYGADQADDTHPYGHARIETAATVAMGVLLLMVAAGIIWEGLHRLMEPQRLWQPGWLALSITVLSILTKEALYHYTLRVAQQLRSPLLRANAWHHRSDAISSVVVLVGITGSLFGVIWLDAVSAIVVAVMIGQMGWSLGWQSMQELIDTGVSPEKLTEIRDSLSHAEGVESLHQLRTRRMGGTVLVDVHILVSSRLTVSEGHQISEAVRHRLIHEQEEITDVTVHIDPEDDEQHTPNARLPLRSTVLRDLQAQWQNIPAAAHIEGVNLHYLSGQINVDIQLPLRINQSLDEAEALSQRFAELASQVPYVRRVQVYYH